MPGCSAVGKALSRFSSTKKVVLEFQVVVPVCSVPALAPGFTVPPAASEVTVPVVPLPPRVPPFSSTAPMRPSTCRTPALASVMPV